MKRWSDQRNVTAMAITAPIILASCSGVSFLGLYYVFHHLLPVSVSDFVWYRFSEQEIYIRLNRIRSFSSLRDAEVQKGALDEPGTTSACAPSMSC
jgi:hypothetical protein